MKKNKKILIITIIIATLITVTYITSIIVFSNNSLIYKRWLKAQENTNTLRATYEVKKVENNNVQVLIIFESTTGIEKITYPENKNELTCNGKNKVAIDYNSIDGKTDEFKVLETGQTEKTYTLVAKAKSQIEETQGSNYPIAIADKIKIDKKATINYQYTENCKNYYSLDGGQNWQEYTSEIYFNRNSNIEVKTETNENIITPVEKRTITINLASDALALAAYDGNSNTSDTCHDSSKYILVDPSAIGKAISITADPRGLSYGMTCTIKMIDNNGNSISEYSTVYKKIFEIKIPENTVKIMINTNQSYYFMDVFMIVPANEKINLYKSNGEEIKEYQILTINGIEERTEIAQNEEVILELTNQKPELLDNYYSLDGGVTWTKYTDKINITYPGYGKIQAKQINKISQQATEPIVFRKNNNVLNKNCYDR